VSSKNAVKLIELTSIDVSILDGAYLPINPLGLDEACFMVRIINDSNLDVHVSYDGVTDHEFVMYGESLKAPIPPDTGSKVNFAKGSIVYVSGDGAQYTGNIYLSGYYRANG